MNKTIAITATVMFAVILGMSAMSPALAVADPKVTICHHDQDTGEDVTITVGPKAAATHLEEHIGDYTGSCQG